jgi:hypothetical protein
MWISSIHIADAKTKGYRYNFLTPKKLYKIKVTTQVGTEGHSGKGTKKEGNYSGRHSGAKAQRHKERSLAANWQNTLCLCAFAPLNLSSYKV